MGIRIKYGIVLYPSEDQVCNCGSAIDGHHDHATCGPPSPATLVAVPLYCGDRPSQEDTTTAISSDVACEVFERQGWWACHLDTPFNRNPYVYPSPRYDWWADGWYEAEQEPEFPIAEGEKS